MEMEYMNSPEVTKVLIENKHGNSFGDETKDGGAKEVFCGLNKKELMELDEKEPFWRRLRLVMFILFIAIWVAMLVGAITIIVLTPKCPFKPKQEFWQEHPSYRINVFAFKDGDNDGVGDMKGLEEKVNYVTDELGFENIILDPIFKGYYTNNKRLLGLVTDFKDIDPALGNKADFLSLFKKLRRKGKNVILTMDINAVSYEHEWFNKTGYLITSQAPNKWFSRSGGPVSCGDGFYQVYGGSECLLPDLNLENKELIEEIKDIVKYWLQDIGIQGILFTNTAFYVEDFENATVSGVTTPHITVNANKYLNWKQEGQVFNNKTINLLREIRTVFDEVSKSVGKKKVLLVEAGNAGYEQSRGDDILKFLGTADGVVASTFLVNSGAHYDITTPFNERFVHLLNQPPNPVDIKIGLTTATQYDAREKSLQSLLFTFLLPGFPIVYQGVELGQVSLIRKDLPDPSESLTLYPKEKRSLFYVQRTDKQNMYDFDVYNHAMLRWTSNRLENKSDYWPKMNPGFSVELLTSDGAPSGPFDLVKSLLKLRSANPMLQWGYAKVVMANDVTIIERYYEGHSKILAVYSSGKSIKPIVYNTKMSCEFGAAELIYKYPSGFTSLNIEHKVARLYVNAEKQGFMILRC